MLDDFVAYLKVSTNITDVTISNYERGVRAASKQMLLLKIIDKPFEEMSATEFELAFFLTMNNADFRKKDSVGHRMYSRGLKQFQAFLKTSQNDAAEKIIKTIQEDTKLKQTEKDSIVKSRIGQGDFRKRLIEKYNGTCMVPGLTDTRLLIASHIKPWSVSSNSDRLDTENGFLLNCLFDKMFDLGIITFKNDGMMIVSNSIKKNNIDILNPDVSKIYDLKASQKLLLNLEYHRDIVFLQ